MQAQATTQAVSVLDLISDELAEMQAAADISALAEIVRERRAAGHDVSALCAVLAVYTRATRA